MTQQPNIPKRINSKVTEMNTSVPRSQGNLSDNTITTIDEEIFSIPSPDSGYALKLIKEFQPLWSQHYKKNLITKVVTNLVIYQASKAGRAPTRSDVVKVVQALSITENSVGILDKEILLKFFPNFITIPSNKSSDIKEEAYTLKINSEKIEIIGSGYNGVFYGIQTLIQILEIYKINNKIPKLSNEDYNLIYTLKNKKNIKVLLNKYYSLFKTVKYTKLFKGDDTYQTSDKQYGDGNSFLCLLLNTRN